MAFGIIRDEFPPARVTTGIGIISSILGIGTGVGIVLAGPIVVHLSYHWLFWMPLFMTVLATVATLSSCPPSPVLSPGSHQLAGGGVHVGLAPHRTGRPVRGAGWGWTATGCSALSVATVFLIGLWIWVEIRSDAPWST